MLYANSRQYSSKGCSGTLNVEGSNQKPNWRGPLGLERRNLVLAPLCKSCLQTEVDFM
jgi:hypothetical protein